MLKKNKILLIGGMGDTFFSPSSKRVLPNTKDLLKSIEDLIKSNIYSGYVNILTSSDSNFKINPLESAPKSKIINIQLHSDSLIDISNSLSISDHSGEVLLRHGSDFDFILPPSNYEIHLAGVDLNGLYSSFIKELLDKGYKVFLYSNMLKRFKNTEDNVKAIKHKNFSYCSASSAIS